MSTSNNLPPELTARIEELKKKYSSPYYLRNHTEAGIIEMACMVLAEPLHKEMEELKAALADTEDSRQEYIRLFHEQERENDALEAQLAEAKKAQEWHPVGTAPKDGTYIFLAGPSGFIGTPLRVEVCKYVSEYRHPWRTYSSNSFQDSGGDPTHWMPLPKPPTS